MWHIIGAELEYYKIRIAVALLFLTGIIFAVLVWGWESAERDVFGLSTILVVVTLVLWFVRLITFLQEKTERFHLTLPLAAGRIGAARLMLLIVFWLSIMALFGVALLVFRPESLHVVTIWYPLSITGIVLAINAFPFLHRDLMHVFTGKFQIIILTGIYAVIVMATALLFSSTAMQRYFPAVALQPVAEARAAVAAMNATPSGAIFLLIFGLGLTCLDIVVFQHRKHYLD